MKRYVRYSQKRVHTVTNIFNAEEYPIPIGFTEEDVNTEAPRLFSDTIGSFNTIRNKIKEPKICKFLCTTCVYWLFNIYKR